MSLPPAHCLPLSSPLGSSPLEWTASPLPRPPPPTEEYCFPHNRLPAPLSPPYGSLPHVSTAPQLPRSSPPIAGCCFPLNCPPVPHNHYAPPLPPSRQIKDTTIGAPVRPSGSALHEPREPLVMRQTKPYTPAMAPATSRAPIRLSAGPSGITAEQQAIWDRVHARGGSTAYWPAMKGHHGRLPPPVSPKKVKEPDMDSEADFPPLGSANKEAGRDAAGQSASTGSTRSLAASLSGTTSISSSPTTSREELSSVGGTDISGETTNRPLDRFAAPFVPQWLQSLPPPIHRHALPSRPAFPPAEYASLYFSPRHLLSATSLDAVCGPFARLPPYKGAVTRIDSSSIIVKPVTYATHFTALLSLAFQAQVIEARESMVHITALKLHADRRANAPPTVNTVAATYGVHIPGIREDMPRLTIGDKLELRGIFPQQHWVTPEVVEAEVVGLTKAMGHVYLKSAELAMMDLQLPKDINRAASYQIRFEVAIDPVCVMQDAIRRLALALMKESATAWRWLFPDSQHLKLAQKHLPRGMAWYDADLNDEQRSAVRSVVQDDHTVPYLISGPPGTGKTKTIVEAILQILASDPCAHILVCAPSNPAADTVAKRLSRHLGPDDMFRLNAANRTFAEVPDILLPYCCVLDDTFGLPTFDRLMEYRVVVCGLLDSGILSKAHACNGELGRAVVGAIQLQHVRPPKSKVVVEPHWTHLLVDEAAQASEPETDIALSVVLPYHDDCVHYDREPVIVLCGDQHQLGPIISSQAARDGELDVSLLQRLFERNVYAKHTALVKTGHLPSAPAANGSASYKPFTQLVRNYRSMPSILMVPSAMFYQDRLIPAARDVHLMQWSQLPNERIPILFQGCESEEYCIDEGASWFNPGEIDVVLGLIRSLLSECPDVKPKEIAVITPWREQVWRMRSRLREEGLHGVDVGNVEAYQGGEFRITILSCVRSNKRFLAEDRRTNMGFFNEPRRFNVAITRAKELLVVVGNANLLKADPYWNGFLQIMLRNDLYAGPELDIEMTGAYISHIESEQRQTRSSRPNGIHVNGTMNSDNDDDNNNGRTNAPMNGYDQDNEDEDAGLFLAGEMARHILNDD